MANPTGIETAVAPPAEDAMLSYNRATPRDWQAFIRRVLALEARVKAMEEQLSQGTHTP